VKYEQSDDVDRRKIKQKRREEIETEPIQAENKKSKQES
jgi:hypothetical protein